MSRPTGTAGKRTIAHAMPQPTQRKSAKPKPADIEPDTKAAAALDRGMRMETQPDEKFGLQFGGLMEQDLNEFRKKSMKDLKSFLVERDLWAKA